MPPARVAHANVAAIRSGREKVAAARERLQMETARFFDIRSYYFMRIMVLGLALIVWGGHHHVAEAQRGGGNAGTLTEDGIEGDALGPRLDVDELNGLWAGVWTRRPGTNVFDAVWRSALYPEVHDVIRIEKLSDNAVVFRRDGNNGRYYGKLSSDGSMISGTASWYSPGMTWTAWINKTTSETPVQAPLQNDHQPSPHSLGSDDGSSGTPPDWNGAGSNPLPPTDGSQPVAGASPDDGGATPAPNGPETVIFDNWNTGACGLTGTARFALEAPTQITNIELWYNWRRGESTLPFAITIAGQSLVRGSFRRGTCDPNQTAWCMATASLSTNAAAGAYTVQVARGRLCQNGGSLNNGFVRVRGMQ